MSCLLQFIRELAIVNSKEKYLLLDLLYKHFAVKGSLVGAAPWC